MYVYLFVYVYIYVHDSINIYSRLMHARRQAAALGGHLRPYLAHHGRLRVPSA